MEKNVFSLSLIFVNILFGSDLFWFSYKGVTSDKKFVYEQKNISPFMRDYKIGSEKVLSKCRVELDKSVKNDKLRILNKNFYRLLPCFYKASTKIVSRSERDGNGLRDKVEMIIEPTKFIVDFKDDFANITVLR